MNALFNSDDAERGQVGIGTLIVFIAMVLVAAIAAGVLVNTAGFLQEKAQQTGEESTSQVSDGIRAVSTYGQVGASTNIKNITIVIRPTPGAGPIDVDDATVQMIGSNGEDTFTHDGTPGTTGDDADEPKRGFFGLAEIAGYGSGGDASETVMDSDEQRLELELNLDTGTKATTETGDDGLSEGDEVTLKITTSSGATTTVVVNVPTTLDSYSDGDFVEV